MLSRPIHRSRRRFLAAGGVTAAAAVALAPVVPAGPTTSELGDAAAQKAQSEPLTGTLVVSAPAGRHGHARASHCGCGASIAVVRLSPRSRRLATSRAGASDSWPVWSPDGRRIAFSRTTDGSRTQHIWVVDANGRRARQVTRGSRHVEAPAWSPDGRWIAFASPFVGRPIRLVRPSGRGLRAVPGTRSGSNPAWSPDGSRLAFDRGGSIFVSRRDGTHRRRLGSGFEPSWSPDGQRIAFVTSLHRARRDIAVMRADGSARRRLMRNRSSDSNPDWSPDGRWIAFDSVRRQHATYVIDVETRREQRVVRRGISPDWRP